MKWIKCDDAMPGKQHDSIYNKEYCSDAHRFMVCYHRGDDHPFLCQAYLKSGEFIIDQTCHSFDDCPDQYQTKYWRGCIVTHWAFLTYPDDAWDNA